jgi:hypothetical protein
MAPRDFSTDGAFGASQSGSIPGVTMNDPGPGDIPGVTMSDPGPLGTGSARSGGADLGGLVGGPFTSRGPAPSPAAPTSSGGGGFGGGGFSSPPAHVSQTPGAIPGGMGGFGPFASPGGGMGDDTPGGISSAPGVSMMFAGGGSVPDTGGSPAAGIGPSWKNDLDQAMASVDAGLSYGRKLHGLPSEDPSQHTKQLAMNSSDFHKSGNVEDRRDSDPTQSQPVSNNRRTNADRVADKVSDVEAGFNPTSQALGIGDIKPMAIPYPGDGGGGAEGPGPQSSADDPGGGQDQQQPGAIPDDDEETA